MSSPSHSFLIRLIVTSLRRPSSMLYTVEGVTPERYASSLGHMFRWSSISRNRATTASFTPISSHLTTKGYKILRKGVYALAFYMEMLYNVVMTHLRNY